MFATRTVIACLVFATALTIQSVDAGTSDPPQATVQLQEAVGNKRADALAAELALVEAKLLAVNKQASGSGATTASSPSDPLGVEAFCSKVAATDRSLAFDFVSRDDRQKVEKAEADRIGKSPGNEQVQARRQALVAQQEALWLRLTLGTFAARDTRTNAVYLYRLKPPAPGDPSGAMKHQSVEAGVKAIRTIEAVFLASDESLKSPSGDFGMATVAKVVGDVTTQTKGALQSFQESVQRSLAVLTDADKAPVETISKPAAHLKESLEAAIDAQSRLSRAEDDVSRSLACRQFQDDLLDAFAAASQLDQSLLALANDWKLDMDEANRLGPALPVRAATRPKQSIEKPKPQVQKEPKPQAIEEVFPQGSTWAGRDGWSKGGTRGTVIKVDDGVATMRYENDIGMFEFTFDIRRDRVALLKVVGIGRQNDRNVFAEFFNVNVGAPFNASAKAGELILTGSMDGARPEQKRQFTNKNVKIEIKRDSGKPSTTGK